MEYEAPTDTETDDELDSGPVFEDSDAADAANAPEDDLGHADALASVALESAQSARIDLTSRSLRTLLQAVIAAAVVAAVALVQSGVGDWRAIAWAGAQAALTVVVTFVHGKVSPVA